MSVRRVVRPRTAGASHHPGAPRTPCCPGCSARCVACCCARPGFFKGSVKTRFLGPKTGFCDKTRFFPGSVKTRFFSAPAGGGLFKGPARQNPVFGSKNRVLGQNPVFSGFRQNPVFGPKTRFWGKTGKKPRTRTGKRNPVLNLDQNRVFSRFSCRGQNPVSENPGSKPGFKTRKKPGFGPKPGFFLVLRGRGCGSRAIPTA